MSSHPPTKRPYHRPLQLDPSASQRDQPAEEQVQIHETALPGVGFRHDLTTRRGRQLGVVSHRTGRRDLILYNQRDPDAAQEVVQLPSAESEALGGLLGSSRITRTLTELQQQVEGLAIAWLSITPGAPYAGRTIADTQARTRTGVSIVAVLRNQTAIPAQARLRLRSWRHCRGGRHPGRGQGPCRAAGRLTAMHAAVLLLELSGVLLGLGLLGLLAGRVGVSPIPLYLLAGLAFGQGGLLPLVTAQEFIQVGAEIGIILLLLLLGLEYSARELLGTLRTAAPDGARGVPEVDRGRDQQVLLDEGLRCAVACSPSPGRSRVVWSFVYLALAAAWSWSCSASGRRRPRKSRSWCCATSSQCYAASTHGPGCSPPTGRCSRR